MTADWADRIYRSSRNARAVVALAFALVACGDAQPDIGDSAASAGVAPDSVSPVQESRVTPQQPAATIDKPVATAGRLALEGEGLRVFVIPSGSAQAIPFGLAKTDAMTMLENVQGSALEQGENIDCGASYAHWANGLTTWFSRNRFAGWSLRSGTDTLTTASGIGLGSTSRELEGAYDALIALSSLGIEFTAGGLGGLLESSSPDARIVNLWAGVACLGR